MADRLPGEAQATRRGEELNAAALTEYLRGKIPNVENGFAVSQFPSGHSNLTYLLTAGTHEYVLRRAPLGPVPPKAHDIAREYHVLQSVHPHFPEAPRVLHLCENLSIIGAIFYLMERRCGIILRNSIPPEISKTADYASQISEAFIRCLVRLHAVDVAGKGLLALGKPVGFLERQVEGWAERWQRAKTEEISAMEDVIHWLRHRRPVSATPTLVHNDYKLDNVMLAAGRVNRIEAVLDWEMTTIGDPLADLGLTLCYWSWAHTPELSGPVVSSLTSGPGWFSREHLIGRYAELSGRDVSRISFYEVLGIFKLAVILQQIYFRFCRGQTTDQRFADFGARVQSLVTVAAHLAEQNACAVSPRPSAFGADSLSIFSISAASAWQASFKTLHFPFSACTTPISAFSVSTPPRLCPTRTCVHMAQL